MTDSKNLKCVRYHLANDTTPGVAFVCDPSDLEPHDGIEIIIDSVEEITDEILREFIPGYTPSSDEDIQRAVEEIRARFRHLQ